MILWMAIMGIILFIFSYILSDGLRKSPFISIFFLVVGITLFLFGVMIETSTEKEEINCLNEFGEKYCLDNNFTFYEEYRGKTKFKCINSKERIGEIYGVFRYLQEEIDNCKDGGK